MSARKGKVEELLRREVAQMLLRGEIKDHRLSNPAAISITGARVSADLSSAVVFVDVMGIDPSDRPRELKRVLAGLNAATGVVRTQIGKRVRLRRTPSLKFEEDTSIEGGARIEAVLAEIRAEEAATQTPDGDD
jgi:ribosome-binding factor A